MPWNDVAASLMALTMVVQSVQVFVEAEAMAAKVEAKIKVRMVGRKFTLTSAVATINNIYLKGFHSVVGLYCRYSCGHPLS